MAENQRIAREQGERSARLKEENDKLQKLLDGNLNDFSSRMNGLFDRQIQAVEKLPDPPKSDKFSTAMLGKTSAGKSSTINALFGTHARTSPIRCTRDVKPVYEGDSIVVFDVFGDNDEESYHSTEILLQAKTLHKIVIVYTESVDGILKMARLMKALRTPLVFFRNKSEDLTPDELMLVQGNDAEQLQKATGQTVTLIVGSAKTGMNLAKLKAELR